MSQEIAYLQSLKSIRDRANKVFEAGKQGKLNWALDLEKLPEVEEFVSQLIKRDYKQASDIPPHARWRHIDAGGVARVDQLITALRKQGKDEDEQLRCVLDLFVVSVLLDAGAGAQWKYQDASGKVYSRSEGLAVAAFDMFHSGGFSSDKAVPLRVDSDGLKQVTVAKLAAAFQHDAQSNKLEGLEGRCMLLNRLGDALKRHVNFFGSGRCGYLYDYLVKHETTKNQSGKKLVKMEVLWRSIIDGYGDVWPPTRTIIDGVSMGDVWPCNALKSNETNGHLVPFHKLSQWLTYSLMEPMQKLGHVDFENLELMTGLAEYRNGGLFVDFGVLKLKPDARERGVEFAMKSGATAGSTPLFEVHDQVIVEWRALTIVLLDILGRNIPAKFGLSTLDMPLVKVLEGGTWKAGREIAAKLRPESKSPPVQIVSDGTVF